MTQLSLQSQKFDSTAVSSLTSKNTPASNYEPPAIIYRGSLETRAGSPLANPLNDLLDPDNPIK